MTKLDMSLQEFGKKIFEATISIEDALLYMADCGCVTLDYDCEFELWECEWNPGEHGKVYSSKSYEMRTALLGAASKHFVDAVRDEEKHGNESINR